MIFDVPLCPVIGSICMDNRPLGLVRKYRIFRGSLTLKMNCDLLANVSLCPSPDREVNEWERPFSGMAILFDSCLLIEHRNPSSTHILNVQERVQFT